MAKSFFASLGGRILSIIVLAIILTLSACLIVIHNRYLSFSKADTEKELRNLLIQAESTTDSIGNLAQSGAFNYPELARELKAKGKENYRATLKGNVKSLLDTEKVIAVDALPPALDGNA